MKDKFWGKFYIKKNCNIHVQNVVGGAGESKAVWTMLKRTAKLAKDGFPYTFL